MAVLLIGGPLAPSCAPGIVASTIQRVNEKLKPVDETARDSSLRELRRAVLAAAAARDVNRLRVLFGPEVKIDCDKALTPPEAVAELRSYSASDQALFWQDLREAVSLGFSLDGIGACAPYVVFELPDRVDGSFEPIGDWHAPVSQSLEPDDCRGIRGTRR